MLFTPRISTRELARLCRRLATSVEAGLDLRTIWAREAKRVTGPTCRPRFQAISDAVNRGESLHDALDHTGEYFPPLFLELVGVGEETGRLGEAFEQLADHYDFQLKLAGTFIVSITWPLVELGIAIVAVGILIYVLGAIGQSKEMSFDVLGLGLSANLSLFAYVAFVACAGSAVFGLIYAVRRGLVWTRPVQRALLRVPVLGGAIESLALARLAWSLYLTLSSGMDIRRAVRLSVRSTHNAQYTRGMKSLDAMISSGDSLYDAFLETRAYPALFLDTLHVGEQTGKLDESMARLARQYRDQAEAAMKTLGVFGFFAVFGVIALIIILVIFRLVTLLYLGPIYEALDILPH